MTRRTVVAFHAHPDDEALLTGGTLARAATEGHRVVLVVATAGEAGRSGPTGRADAALAGGAGPRGRGAPASGGPAAGLGPRRWAELLRSAEILGCARVEGLGYADSGLDGAAAGPGGGATQPGGATRPGGGVAGSDGGAAGVARRFVDVPVDEAAGRLAAVVAEERADLLLSYDARGGYGHPDHVQVHRVGARAAALTGTPVLEATIDRDTLRPLIRLLGLAGRLLPSLPLGDVGTVFSARAAVTHEIDVRAASVIKKAALAAHVSQTENGIRTVGALSRLPTRAFTLIAGREWFIDPTRPRPARPYRDIFDTT